MPGERAHHEKRAAPPRGRWRRRWVGAVAGVLLVGAISLGVAAVYVARHAEPILRGRVVATLQARFHSPVELDHLDISVMRGIEVRGTGLRIQYLAGPTKPDAPPVGGGPTPPMVSVAQFSFRTTLKGLLRSPTRVATVYVQGMELHIPPAGQRGDVLEKRDTRQAKIALLVDHIVCDDAKIFIETSEPGKDPLEFDIKRVVLTDVGADQPFLYDADLTNPKPVGQIHADGHFGPWQSSDPRETPLDGDYSFEHADLKSIKGLGGTLSSTGHFAGQLGHITIDGTTDTPNFSLDVSDHPVPLHTVFHAFVDGTTGDTTLAPVTAQLLHTTIVAQGAVMQVHGKGHDIALTTSVANGRIEDVLALGMKSRQPVMHGAVTLAAKLHVPPGAERVAKKLELAGSLKIVSVEFTNPVVQDKVDSLSMRAQGRPEEATAAGSDKKAEVASGLTTNFSLDHGLMLFNSVQYQMPGAMVMLDGAYSLEGNDFDFKGHVRTDAKASQMVTGWKSLVLKPFDKFLEKNGAGVQLPIEVHGTKSDVHVGLAMHGDKESPQDIAADVKAQGNAAKAAK